MICCLYFFPEQPMDNDHPSALKMRKTITMIVIGHLLFAILTLTFVAFTTFLGQLFYVVILYSFYMTLRDCMLWVYAALLVFNLLIGVLTVFTLDSWSSFIVYMLLMLYYLGVLFILNKD
jgi:hypothetical protein